MCADNSIHFRLINRCTWESVKVFETENVLIMIHMIDDDQLLQKIQILFLLKRLESIASELKLL